MSDTGVEREYQYLRQLLKHAEANENLDAYTSELVLYADRQTQHIVDMNPVAADALGYSREELLQKSIPEIEVADPSGQTSHAYRETGTDIYEYECRYRHRDGYLIPARVQKREVPHGGITVVRYGIEDMSLHKQFARELLRRQDTHYKFNEKLKILNEINMELGKMTSFDEVCRRGIELGIERLGFDRLSLWFLDSDGKTMRGAYGVDESGSIRDERAERWQYGGSYVEDFVNGKRDARVQTDAPIYNEKSEIIDYGWHISAPIVDGNDFIGFIATDNYINRKPMQNYQPELLRLYGASIGHIAARQHEQETIRLLRQQEEHLRLEHERMDILQNFVRDVSHEFRTPLSIISTSIYLLSRAAEDDPRKKYIGNANEQVAYLNKLVNDMLYIVKLGGEKSLEQNPVELSDLVQEIVSQTNKELISRNLKMELVLTPVTIMADAEKLNRAITEILNNAVIFNNVEGEIRVHLQVDGEHVHLSIQDTGIGITKYEQEQIFHRFYRVNQARTTRGSGLGLSIAKMIVEAHRGTITVQSQPGQGSTFTITLNHA